MRLIIAFNIFLAHLVHLSSNNHIGAGHTSSRAPLNPEKGFHIQTLSRSSNFKPLTKSQLEGYREGKHRATHVRRLVVLDDFKKSPLSDDFLDDLEKDFIAADAAGFTMVLRFSYNDNDNPDDSGYDTSDADIDVAEHHVEQLGKLLRNWQHVIMTIEAGFIGAWGEWYFSSNYNDPDNDFNPTPEQIVKRRRLAKAILDNFPDRQIVFRTPAIAQSVLEDETPLTEGESFSGSDKSRIGLHNDCFVASKDDYGTFTSESDRVWLEKQSRFTFVGGETCHVNHPRSDCDEAWEEIQRYHFSYLNDDYHPDVLDDWKDQGCYNKIADNMGYRFHINYDSSSFPEVLPDSGVYKASVKIENTGVSRILNKKSLKIIFIGLDEYEFSLDDSSTDLRKVGAGESTEIHIEVHLANLPPGHYTVAMVVEGEGSSVWKRIVMEPYEENADRLNILSSLHIQGDGSECDGGCGSSSVCLHDQCIACPWKLGSSCYNLAPVHNRMTYPDGEDYCSTHFYGTLVAPSTEEEMMWLQGKLNEAVETDEDLKDWPRAWTGGILSGGEGSDGPWFWSNGEEWVWQYMTGVSHGDHIYLSENDSGDWKWHGNDDTEHYPVLCETHYK